MSHTSTVKAIKITSISALRSALQELNQAGIRCSLIENATPRAYYQNQQGMGAANYVIKLEDCPYDLGLYLQADKSYDIRTDFFAGHVERVLGAKASEAGKAEQAKLGKLLQMYGLNAASEAARKKGHMVRRVVKADGVIALEITGANL